MFGGITIPVFPPAHPVLCVIFHPPLPGQSPSAPSRPLSNAASLKMKAFPFSPSWQWLLLLLKPPQRHLLLSDVYPGGLTLSFVPL